MSNILDPDQAGHFVGLDLDPICLQWLSGGKELVVIFLYNLDFANNFSVLLYPKPLIKIKNNSLIILTVSSCNVSLVANF